MANGFMHLIRFLTGTADDGHEKPIVDLSPGVPDDKVEIRVVREGDHVGTAFGGDRVRIAKAELAHPSVARALLTEAEYAELIQNQAQRLIGMLRPEPSPAMRAADAALERHIKARREREERERVERLEAEQQKNDLERARLDRLAAEVAERLKKSG